MSLVKWIRKNNRKIMVFVVIFSMVSFVVGYTGLQILTNIFNPAKKTLARYGDGMKMNSIDLMEAQNELNVLRQMMSDQMLSGQGISGVLLARLIFPDSPFIADLASQLKQAVQQGQVQMSLDELEAYFNRPQQQPESMWLLLKAEAYRAGYVVSAQQAEQFYLQFLTELFRQTGDLEDEQIGPYASQFFSQTVGNLMAEANLTQDRIFRLLADLLSVVQYANTVMNNEAVTLDQVKSFLERTEERLDAEFVRINAMDLVDENAPVSDVAVQEQFQAYKDTLPNMPTEENPFGFGYKLPRRLQVEYMILLMDDVKAQLEPPTPEAMEEYYSNNIRRFQTQVPSDPNDPDSEPVTRTRSFGEVALQIRNALENEKASNLANMIFNAVKDRTESGFDEVAFEDAGVEQLQMAAGDYQAVAQEVAAEFNVPLKTGKTGWLSPTDLYEDNVLSTMSLQYQQSRIPLPQLLLSASPQPQAQRRIGLPNIRVWQNIGPVSGGYSAPEQRKYYQIMGMFRVVDIRDEAVPDSPEVQYDTSGIVLFEDAQQEQSRFSLTETINEDLRLVNAMKTAQARADELAQMVQQQGWDQAIDAYNEKYAPEAGDPNAVDADTQPIALETVEQQTRASQTELQYVRRYIRENPSAAYMVQNLIQDAFNARLYELLPEDVESTDTIHEVLVFKPSAAAFVVKNVTRQPPTWDDYLESKPVAAMQLSMQDMVRLAMVHFDPENINERMNYQRTEDDQQTPAEQATGEEEQE